MPQHCFMSNEYAEVEIAQIVARQGQAGDIGLHVHEHVYSEAGTLRTSTPIIPLFPKSHISFPNKHYCIKINLYNSNLWFSRSQIMVPWTSTYPGFTVQYCL